MSHLKNWWINAALDRFLLSTNLLCFKIADSNYSKYVLYKVLYIILMCACMLHKLYMVLSQTIYICKWQRQKNRHSKRIKWQNFSNSITQKKNESFFHNTRRYPTVFKKFNNDIKPDVMQYDNYKIRNQTINRIS